jgi:hypothetical protein
MSVTTEWNIFWLLMEYTASGYEGYLQKYRISCHSRQEVVLQLESTMGTKISCRKKTLKCTKSFWSDQPH